MSRSSKLVSVVIADDQPVIRDALVELLSLVDEIVVVGVAQDGAGAVALAESCDVDVVLMDLHMPGTDGVEATGRLAATRPDTAVIVLTTYEDDEALAAACAAGASSYLTKDASTHDILRAVQAAGADHPVADLNAAPNDKL